jgi:hypothetical protein
VFSHGCVQSASIAAVHDSLQTSRWCQLEPPSRSLTSEILIVHECAEICCRSIEARSSLRELDWKRIQERTGLQQSITADLNRHFTLHVDHKREVLNWLLGHDVTGPRCSDRVAALRLVLAYMQGAEKRRCQDNFFQRHPSCHLTNPFT